MTVHLPEKSAPIHIWENLCFDPIVKPSLFRTIKWEGFQGFEVKVEFSQDTLSETSDQRTRRVAVVLILIIL